jgi:hypothetical protein
MLTVTALDHFDTHRVARTRHAHGAAGYRRDALDIGWHCATTDAEARRALALGLLILRAQRREEPAPVDGSDHPVTCQRRCCR